MGWNGSGTFTRSYDWTNERDAGYKIDAAKFDTENNNFKDGINACLAKNGENAATADLPMGGFKHTGVDKGTALSHYATVNQVQDSVLMQATTGGAANVQTLDLTVAPAEYDGQVFYFTAGFTNTGSMTLNVNSLGAGAVTLNGAALVGGEIISGQSYAVKYNSVAAIGVHDFDIIGPMPVASEAMACKAKRTTAQTYGAGVTDNIEFTAVDDYDPHDLHDISTNNDRIILGRVGLWSVSANITSDVALTAGNVAIIWNATQFCAKTTLLGQKDLSVSGMVYASAATDYITVTMKNGTAGSADINPAYFCAAFVG